MIMCSDFMDMLRRLISCRIVIIIKWRDAEAFPADTWIPISRLDESTCTCK